VSQRPCGNCGDVGHVIPVIASAAVFSILRQQWRGMDQDELIVVRHTKRPPGGEGEVVVVDDQECVVV